MAFKTQQKQKPKATHRPAAPGASPYDDSKHPRAGKGVGGGRFTGKGGSSPASSSRSSSNVKDPVKALTRGQSVTRAAANAGAGKRSRRIPKIVSRGLPPAPKTDVRKALPKRVRTRGMPPLAIAASDQAPLSADPATLARMIGQAKQLGVTKWRLVMEWGQVYKDGEFDFSAYDGVVDAMNAAGIKTRLTVLGTAGYHPDLDQQLSSVNADPGKARWFAQQVATHFKGRVGQYDAWNEPNLGNDTFLRGGMEDPLKYRRLFTAMRDGFHAADAGAEVGFGELVPYAGTAAWLHKALKGLKGVGSVTVHSYQWDNQPPWNQPRDASSLGISSLDYLRTVVNASGASGKKRGKSLPIDITEMGYNPDPAGWLGVPDQGKWLAGALKTANDYDARSFTLYGMFGGAPPPAGAVDIYGNATDGGAQKGGTWDTSVVDGDGNPRPSFYAAQRAIRAIRAKRVRARSASAKKKTPARKR